MLLELAAEVLVGLVELELMALLILVAAVVAAGLIRGKMVQQAAQVS